MFLLTVPGQTALIIMRSATTGRGSLLVETMVAAALGGLAATVLCDVGLGSVLATSATALHIFRVCAGLYLVVVGVMSLRRSANPQDGVQRQDVRRHTFSQCLRRDGAQSEEDRVLRAFLPQLIETSHDVAWQLAVRQATFVVLLFLAAGTWAVSGARLQSIFGRTWIGGRLRYVFAVLMFGAGFAEAIARV